MTATWVCRLLLTASLLACAGTLVEASAQTPGRVYRLALLSTVEVPSTLRDVLPELGKQGFVEGRNLVVDVRVGPVPMLAGLARELLAGRPDAAIAVGAEALTAVREATTTLPIVGFGPDPVRQGYAESYARPGGNVTGVTILTTDLDAKRLDLLREALPGVTRFAILYSGDQPSRVADESGLRELAAARGLELVVVGATSPADYGAAFEAMRTAGARGLVISSSPRFNRDGAVLAGLATAASLPTACQWAGMARAGCLLGYGPDATVLWVQLAGHVARVLRGVPPGLLPIETPTRFEFAINAQVARTLGVSLSSSLLARADEVIE